MKRILPISAALIIAFTLGGCKSKPVSRVYNSDMDTTWAAVLRVAEKVSKEKPSKVDRENGKIVTGLIYGDVKNEYNSDSGYIESERSVDVWQAVITCKAEGPGTRVTVVIRKGSASTTDHTTFDDRQGADLGVEIWSTDKDWQQQLLNKIAAELAPG